MEDYACLCDGLLSLHRASPNPKYIVMANALLTKAIELFYDAETQQMAFTPKNGEALIVRKSDLNDDVIASPNSILSHCLFQLGMLQSNQEFIQLANTLLLQVSSPMIQSPGWYFNWSRLAQSITLGGCHIKIDGGHRQNLKPLYQHLPSWTTLEYNENNAEMQIMVCCNNTCFPPVNNMAQALEIAIDCCALSEA